MFALWTAQFCRPLPPLLAAGTTRRFDSRTVHRFASFELATPTRPVAGNRGASQLPDSSLVPCHALGPRQAFDSLTLAAVLFRLPPSLTGSPPAFICSVTRLDCFRETRPPLRPGTFPSTLQRWRSPEHRTIPLGWFCFRTSLQDSVRVIGFTLLDGDSHPARRARLALAH